VGYVARSADAAVPVGRRHRARLGAVRMAECVSSLVTGAVAVFVGGGIC
jgi:hypothetical protein